MGKILMKFKKNIKSGAEARRVLYRFVGKNLMKFMKNIKNGAEGLVRCG